MRVLLINPPRSPHNAILEHAPKDALPFIHRKLIGPPLGLLTVAAAVRNHDVVLLEMKGEYDLDPNAPPPRRLVRDYLEKVDPHVVGITFIASEFPAGMEIFREVKRYNPGIVTVAGGLHATLCPNDFSDSAVDIICPGQSAERFREVVDTLEGSKGKSAAGIRGLYLNTREGLVHTDPPAREVNAAADGFLLPDRSLLNRWISTYRVGGGKRGGHGPATYVFTSLGCPYRCSFCSIWPQHDGRFLQREVDSLVEELMLLDEYPIVRFADANTIVDPRFVERLFDRIEEEGIRKEFIMDVRTDTAADNPRLIEKLARGGLKVVISGFESFRNEELERYNKSAREHQIKEAIRVFHDNGIMIRGNYVVPPDYDEDDFRALADYAGSHEVAYAGYTILTPMPGTKHFEEMKTRIVDPDLARYNFFNCVLEPTLPLQQFYETVGALWRIRKGTDMI